MWSWNRFHQKKNQKWMLLLSQNAMDLHNVVLHVNEKQNGVDSGKHIMIKVFALSYHFKIQIYQPVLMCIMNWNLQQSKDVLNTVSQEIFVSEKFRQKGPSGSSSGIYFRQTSVIACCSSVVRSSLCCLSFIFTFMNIFDPTLVVLQKQFSQEFNLVKKLLWRKRRN